MNAAEPLSVAILAGGQSRRMGRDKALLELGGRTLLEHVVARVQPVASEIIVVASRRPEYDRFGLRLVDDLYPQSGSLGGIYTAISAAKHSHCLVVACDMPFVNTELVAYMASLPRTYDVLVPALPAERSDQGGKETLETLHAIYSKACLPAIERHLREGIFKIVGFFSEVRVERVPEETVRRFDPQLLSFFNANTPEEFEWAQRKLTERDSADGARPGGARE